MVAGGPRAERGGEVQARYGVRVTADNVAAARKADGVILSVKPQVLPAMLAELRGHIRPTALVFSIVAGNPVATIRARLDHAAIVRTMPNTPAQIGEGMTVWTAAPADRAAACPGPGAVGGPAEGQRRKLTAPAPANGQPLTASR